MFVCLYVCVFVFLCISLYVCVLVCLFVSLYFFRPCFFSEAKKVKERFKVVVVGGGSDRWASPASVCP